MMFNEGVSLYEILFPIAVGLAMLFSLLLSIEREREK